MSELNGLGQTVKQAIVQKDSWLLSHIPRLSHADTLGLSHKILPTCDWPKSLVTDYKAYLHYIKYILNYNKHKGYYGSFADDKNKLAITALNTYRQLCNEQVSKRFLLQDCVIFISCFPSQIANSPNLDNLTTCRLILTLLQIIYFASVVFALIAYSGAAMDVTLTCH